MGDAQIMNDKLNMWIVSKGMLFPSDAFTVLQNKLTKLAESEMNKLYALPLRDPTIMLLMCIFLSPFGLDRFLLGNIGMGILRVLFYLGIFILSTIASGSSAVVVFFVFGIAFIVYAIYEIVTCMRRTREYNLKIVIQTIGYIG